MSTPSADWSPADNPYSVAVSEARAWLASVRLAALRLRDGDDRRFPSTSSRQIDARTLMFALRQMLTAEQLEQTGLDMRNVDPSVSRRLTEARDKFTSALPEVKNMRDALMHFEDWALGKGDGQAGGRRSSRPVNRVAARDFWGFGYDPAAGTVSMGPYRVDVDVAVRAATDLAAAIYAAARAVDAEELAELRRRTVLALAAAGITPGGPDDPDNPLRVSPGHDSRIWVSVNPAVPGQVASDVIDALAVTGLRLESPSEPHAVDMASLLAGGAFLLVRPDTGSRM